MGPILAYAARTNQEPRELLPRAGVPDATFAAIARAGLTLPQIDHVVAGTSAHEPSFTLVLVLRRPLDDEEPFLQKLQAQPNPWGKKDHFNVTLDGRFPLYMVRVSPRV